MHRLFLDANFLFSMAYGSNSFEILLKRADQGHIKLLASSYVVEEAMRNLSRPEHFARLQELLNKLTIVPEADPGLPCAAALPVKDVPVLMAAVQAGATHLITGDLSHFGAYRGKTIQNVLICTPRDYIQRTI